MAIEISEGMNFLSSKGVVHRNLTCSNIMVDASKQVKMGFSFDFFFSSFTHDFILSLKRLGKFYHLFELFEEKWLLSQKRGIFSIFNFTLLPPIFDL